MPAERNRKYLLRDTVSLLVAGERAGGGSRNSKCNLRRGDSQWIAAERTKDDDAARSKQKPETAVFHLFPASGSVWPQFQLL